MIDPLSPEQVSDEAALLPIQEIVAYLQEHLGQRMTAYISGVNDPKMVARWIARQNLPRDEAQIRLREGYQATRLVVDAYGDETAKAWLFGSNAELGNQAPAYMLRQARSWEDLRSIVPAARAFARAEPGQSLAAARLELLLVRRPCARQGKPDVCAAAGQVRRPARCRRAPRRSCARSRGRAPSPQPDRP